MKILIAEDDASLADSLSGLLRQVGCAVTLANTGEEAEFQLALDTFDLVLLDIGLPGRSGLDVLRFERMINPRLPIMILTARDAIEDRIRGLDLGADDYLVKPIVFDELYARIRALVRRARIEGASRLVHGPLQLDTEARRAFLSEKPLELTVREWKALEYLLRRPERVVSKQQLMKACEIDEDTAYNAVEVLLSRLRSKLEADRVEIRTVRGFGYMLEAWNEP